MSGWSFEGAGEKRLFVATFFLIIFYIMNGSWVMICCNLQHHSFDIFQFKVPIN